MPVFRDIREGQFRKVVGPGDVENRIMSSYDVVWQSIAELHGEGVVGDVLKLLQINELFSATAANIGRAEIEAGVAYVGGKRVSKLQQYISIPTPYRVIADEVLAQQELEDLQYVWVCNYAPMVDDSSISLRLVNSSTGIQETLERYTDYTINPLTGTVSIDESIVLNQDDQLKLSYRSRIPMIWWVEVHRTGTVYLHAGSTSEEPPNNDVYYQTPYNGLYAVPPAAATDDSIVVAEIYVPGHIPSSGFANLEEDESRSLVGLTQSQIASGDYGVIRDMRTILTPAAEVLQFQEDFYNMVSNMEEAADNAEQALAEVRTNDAQFESEGVVKTSWSSTLNLYRGLRVEAESDGFGGSELAEGDQQLTVIPGVCYIEQTVGQDIYLMRVPATSTQYVTIDAVGDTPDENRAIRESQDYLSAQALYELANTPVTSVQNVKGEIRYDYTIARSSLVSAFSYSSAFDGGLPTADPAQISPAFEATLTQFSAAQAQNLLSANGSSTETQSAVDANQYAQQVFSISHDNIDKLHTLSIRWDGYGDQYDGSSHHYGATLYIWNNSSSTWEELGQATGNAIGTVQASLTSSLSSYFVGGEKLYLLVAANTPADGSQAAQLWTDFFRVDAYVGRYAENDHTLAADFPEDSYKQTGNQLEWVSGKFLPTNASSFWVEYRTPLPRYDLIQIGLDGIAEVKKGTASATPALPLADSQHLQLAHVYILGNLIIKNQEDAIVGSNGIIYDDRIFIWSGIEGVEAREDADTLLQNLINRTKETSSNPSFVVSGLTVQPYPDENGSEYLQITDGIFYCDGRRFVVEGLAPYLFDFSTLDLNLHRKDVITIDSELAIKQYIGTPDLLQSVVSLPEIPVDEVPLAYIEVTGQMVVDQKILGASISNSPSGADVGDAIIQRADDLEHDGVLEEDISIIPSSPRSRSVSLLVESGGVLYIDGHRVTASSQTDACSVLPMAAEQYEWEENTDFHPFQSLEGSEETNWFNIDSVLSPPLSMPLESIKSITAQALCDHNFRRPFGDENTHQAFHLSHPSLEVDPTGLPSGTPAAVGEFSDAGFDTNNIPVYNDGDNSYQNLMFSDGTCAEKDGSPSDGHYAQQFFKFKHINNKGSITKISVVWHGMGHRSNPNGTTSYGAKLQIWNNTDSLWVDLADGDTNAQDQQELTAEITSSLTKYRTSEGDIWLRSYCTLPAAGGYGASITTDYIECQVTEDNRLMVGNKIRNSDFEYGLDLPYDWDFIGDGTVSWLSTEADAIVNRHRFSKFYGYVWHEYCESETIGDAYANDPHTRSLRLSSNGTQSIMARQRFNINQDASTRRPMRLSAWVKGNVDDSEGETTNCAIALELWNTDNEQIHSEIIELPVGEYDWTEIKSDVLPETPISYGRITLQVLGISGWVAFDIITLAEIPEGHIVYDEEGEADSILSHEIEIDYQPNKDFIDWSPSGFSPVDSSDYSAEIVSWPIRIDSCQIDSGGNLTVYTGEEGQADYGPDCQVLSHVIAEIFVRGDRPITSDDDNFNSYIMQRATPLFTCSEGAAQRDEIDNIILGLGDRYARSLEWGFEPTKKDSTTIEVTAGEFINCGTAVLSDVHRTISGSGAMESGWYYLSLNADQHNLPSLSLITVESGWPQAVVIAKVYWTKSGESGSFGEPIDLRHLSRTPAKVDDIERKLSAIDKSVEIDVYDFTQGALPTPPVLLQPLSGNEKLIITWEASTDPTTVGYTIYRSTIKAGSYSSLGSVDKNTTAFTDTGLTNGSTYWYKVAAVNSSGMESNISLLIDDETNDYAQPQNGSPLATAAPQPPANLSGIAGSHTVSLSWNHVTGTVSGDSITQCTYVVYRSCLELGGSEDGPWVRVNNALLTSNSFVDTNLKNGYTFYYRIAAIREEGISSELSSSVSVVPVAIGSGDVPSSPENVVVKRGCYWGTVEQFDEPSFIHNCIIISELEEGSATINNTEGVTTLSESGPWTINVLLDFMPKDISISLDRITGGNLGFDYCDYNGYGPVMHNAALEMSGKIRYEEKDFGQYNGMWIEDESIGSKALSTLTAHVAHAPVREGSIRAVVSGDDELLSISGVNYSTGEITVSGDGTGEVLVTYQVEHDREHTTDYAIDSVIEVRNLESNTELVENEDFIVLGKHILFDDSPQGKVGFIYNIDIDEEESIYYTLNSISHRGFTIEANPPEESEMNISWTVSGSAIRVATPDTYFDYELYGYSGYGGFEALESSESGTVRYRGDSEISNATWQDALIIANVPDGTTAEFRFRASNTEAGLDESAWSSASVISNSRQVLDINTVGRYIEIEFSLTALRAGDAWLSPRINFCYARTKESLITWNEVTTTVDGEDCNVSSYKIYRRGAGGTALVAAQVNGNSYIYGA
jgi:hypothetical protein